MTMKKRCTKLNVHRAHSWTSTYPQQTYVCEGVAEEAQDPSYASRPYYSEPVTPYYAAPATSSTCANSSSSSATNDSYSSSSDSGSSCTGGE